MTKYYRDPFAIAGDKTAVPDDAQPSGSVSYEQGFTFDYQRNYPSDPNSKPFPRDQFNQVMYDTTLNIQQYQQHAVPNFITSTDNGGTAFSYDKNARVLYDDGVHGVRVYQSLVSSNNTLPSDATKWAVLDTFNEAIIINNVVFKNTVGDGSAVYYDSANSWYAEALANGAAPQNVVGIADTTNKRIFVAGKCSELSGLSIGDTYYLSSSVAGNVTNVMPTFNIVSLGTAISANTLILNTQRLPNFTLVNQFDGVYADPGYFEIPTLSSLTDPTKTFKIQFGTANVPPNNVSLFITLPIPFVQAVANVHGSYFGHATNAGAVGISPSGLTQLEITNSFTVSQLVNWSAMGV